MPSGWAGTPGPDQRDGLDRQERDHLDRRADGHARRHATRSASRARTRAGPSRVNLPVNVVVDIPTAQPPLTSLVSGVTMGRTTLKVRVSWPPATDPSSAIAGYEVQRSTNGGAWTSTVSTPVGAPWPTYTLDFDTVYRFRVRAVDAAGHWSPWVQAVGTSRIHPFDDRSPSVTRSPQLATDVERGCVPGDAERIGQGRGEDQPELHRPCGRPGDAPDAAPRQGQGLHRRRVRPHGQPQGVRRRPVARSLRAWYFPSGGAHTITLRVVGTGTYPLVRLDAFVVSR